MVHAAGFIEPRPANTLDKGLVMGTEELELCPRSGRYGLVGKVLALKT